MSVAMIPGRTSNTGMPCYASRAAGVVDECVDRAELRPHRVDQPRAIVGARHVGGAVLNGGARVPQLFQDFGDICFAPDAAEGEVPPFTREGARHAEADAT